MANDISKYLVNFKTIAYAPVVKQTIFLAGISISIAVGILLFSTIKEPNYRPLDYRINEQNMGPIVDALTKANITFKINDKDGIVYVDEKDVQSAKIKLSAQGISKDDSVSFSYLNDQSGFGNSQFIENAKYIRALETDLAKSISALEGISGARVHLAIPQNGIFADENEKVTASVIVNAAPGLSNDREKIKAIMQIIASSVSGLDPKNVAITDQYGHYLSGELEADSLFDAEKMSYQNKLQGYYEKRIETMIEPLLGNDKVNVRVYANIDFTQKEEAHEGFDPNDKVVKNEQSVEEHSSDVGGASGAPGSLSNTPPDDSKKEGSASSAASGSSGSGNAKSQTMKSYEVGKSVTYTKTTAPKLLNLSIAVVVDNQVIVDPKTKKETVKPLDQEKINKITDIIKASVGYDDKRGDRVTVVNSSFVPLDKDIPIVEQKLWEKGWFWSAIKSGGAILLGIIFIFIVYRLLTRFMKNDTTSVVAAGVSDENIISPEMKKLKQEQINRLKEMASRDPQRVAMVIKNWTNK